jgi:hypothetical protein
LDTIGIGASVETATLIGTGNTAVKEALAIPAIASARPKEQTVRRLPLIGVERRVQRTQRGRKWSTRAV